MQWYSMEVSKLYMMQSPIFKSPRAQFLHLPIHLHIHWMTSDVPSTQPHTPHLMYAMIQHGCRWSMPSYMMQSPILQSPRAEFFHLPIHLHIHRMTWCTQPHNQNLKCAMIQHGGLWTVPSCMMQYIGSLWQKVKSFTSPVDVARVGYGTLPKSNEAFLGFLKTMRWCQR